jgi:endonuclease-3 related protein
MELIPIYRKLLSRFGRQGWWPMTNGFSPPEWEVCIGAILTQNTNWLNVERALLNLKNERIITPADMSGEKEDSLREAIKPSGFYRQKAARLKTFADFVLGFGTFGEFKRTVTRGQLLNVSGLGPETADSILLYALGRPVFVIDAYTRRVFSRLGFKNSNNYEEWRLFFESGLPKDVNVYKELHALIVELAKKYCKAKPLCNMCLLNKICSFHKR